MYLFIVLSSVLQEHLSPKYVLLANDEIMKYLKVGHTMARLKLKKNTTQQTNNPSWRKLVPTVNKKHLHKTWLNTLLGQELPWEPGSWASTSGSWRWFWIEVMRWLSNFHVYIILFFGVSQKSDFRVFFLKILKLWARTKMRPSNLIFFRKQFAIILRATLWEMLILWCPSEWLKILKLNT